MDRRVVGGRWGHRTPGEDAQRRSRAVRARSEERRVGKEC